MVLRGISIVIPAFNEAQTIFKTVTEVKEYGLPIVVDDGSTDETSELALIAGAQVVSHDINMGYDEALNTGFKKAAALGSEIIITFDADGQHDPGMLTLFIDAINLGSDVVVGVRNKRQRFSEYIFGFITYRLYSIEDPLCGLKAYKKEVYDRLGYFDSYKSAGTELTLFAAKSGFRVGQVKFTVRNRLDKPRFGSLIKSNFMILRSLIKHFIL